MNRVLTIALLAAAALPWAGTVDAQPEVSVTLDASPREINIGGTTRLEVRVQARGGDIENLELEDLKKYPELEIISHQTVRPIQFSFGFGSGVQKESSLAHVFVLHPTAPGTYEFSSAVARVDGKVYRSPPLTLVVRGDAGDPRGAGLDPSSAPGATVESDLSGARFDERAFLQTVVESDEVYIGQQVNVAVYLYTRLRLSPQSVIPGKPPMDGFWVHDDPITHLQAQTVPIRGVNYRAYVLQRSAAFPQRSGELTIGPPKVTFDVGGASLFDAPERVERTGVPVTIKVKPLPLPGPSTAVVGQYAMKAWLDRTTADTGDAVTLRVDATGRGNVQDLRIELPPMVGVRILQPAIRDQQRFQEGKLSGSRSWEWILIAEAPGAHTVPPIQLHFFDPDAGTYGTVSTPPLTFTASGESRPSQPTIEPRNAPAAEAAATFGPLRMYSALDRSDTRWRERAWFAWLLATPPTLFMLILLAAWATRRREERSGTAGAVQRKLVRSAHDALQANDPRSFYDRIVESITHALDARLGAPVGGLPHAALRTRLVTEGLDDDLVDRVINELEGADFARFAASGVNKDEMERCRQRTAAIIERIQRSERVT